ncbi:siderophore-iron reductase FhuF [Crenobacter sp. SG2303]|uniref:Siderophore-iron reductase FhuF n=1 Tax=Crenobacter oryzisoli TaxID=3056844 RepID=A0ABT7XQM4_9NEIS|nr:siderophore-iron reductase FhuF [Crenobacter sp. SG2303]MDN0076101.1 siderophore-iron reductase FhuF [Crenobacter sp. SG2303]
MSLHTLLTGELAPCRAQLYAGHRPDALPLATLADGSHLPDALLALARDYAGAPRRAQVSQWAKHYFRLLLPPAIAAALLGLRLPLALERVGLRFDEHGLPGELELDHLGTPAPHDSLAERYQPLLWQHLAPLIDRLAEHGKLSRRVLWNSAGNLIEHLLRHFADEGHPEAQAHADWLLGSRRLADGAANPLWQPVHYVDSFLPQVSSPVRLRRLCCLRYELPGEVCCATCPLLPNKPEEELYALLDRWRAAKA